LYHVRPRIWFDTGVTVEYKYLLLVVEDKVATVTIHRPDKGNALAPDVLEELSALDERANRWRSQWRQACRSQEDLRSELRGFMIRVLGPRDASRFKAGWFAVHCGAARARCVSAL
jgi:hypothetical protein